MAVRRDEINLQLSVNAQQSGNTLRDLQKQARDLRRLLERLPVGSQEFDETSKKLKDINQQIADANAKTKALSTGFGQVAGAGGRVASVFQGILSVFGGFSLAGLVQGALQYVGTLFSLGTSLDGLQAKTRTVFGEAEAIVQGFAETNAQAIGLAQQEYINLATQVGDLLIPMGFTQETAANLSSELLNQAGVLAEWSNGKVTAEQATEILNKALLGERDALNTLGIDIKQSVVDEELKRRGLDDLTGASRRQAEALITLEQITQQSASANEAFSNNQDSAARNSAELRARVAEITQGLARGFVPVVNSVLGVLIPVVDYIAQFATRLVQAYQQSTVFRGIVTGVFQTIAGVVGNVARGIANLGEGFLNLFEGNFTAALDSFQNGFNNLNPLAIGAEIKNQFVAGFNSVRNPQATVDGADQGDDKGKEFARAYTNGFDSEFDRIKQNGTREAKAEADAAKKALDARLKEVELAFAKEELAADAARVRGEISEGQYAKRVLELKQQQYTDQLALFRRFNKEQTREAIAAQRNLLQVQEQLNRPTVAPLQGIAPIALPGSVQSQTAPLLNAADVAAADDEIRILQDKFARIYNAEQAAELLRIELRRNQLAQRLEFLQNAGLTETDLYRRTLEEKFKADEEYQNKALENERRTADIKRELAQAALGASSEALQAGIELLSQDENARKKNAAAIKAFQVAQVTISGISEVQKIWEQSAAFGPLQAIIAVIQTAAAVARTTSAISKIQSAKFARGGYTGPGSGSRDSTGFRPAGIVHEGEYVVPKWMVDNPSMGPVLSYLEGRRLRRFAEGGPTTTPSFSLASVPAASAASDTGMALYREIKGLRQDVGRWNTTLRANVVYTDLEDTAAEVAQVRDDASI